MIRLAKKLAKKAQHTFALHAAIVQKGGAVVATGYNHNWVHAETMALGKLWPSQRKGTKVWSIRVTRGGRLANAKPCKDCESYMRRSGVKVVWYSDDTGQMVRMDL